MATTIKVRYAFRVDTEKAAFVMKAAPISITYDNEDGTRVSSTITGITAEGQTLPETISAFKARISYYTRCPEEEIELDDERPYHARSFLPGTPRREDNGTREPKEETQEETADAEGE